MLKTSTSSVRGAYVRCMLGCVTSTNAHKAAVLIPHLLTSTDKAILQSTQVGQFLHTYLKYLNTYVMYFFSFLMG